MFPTVLITAAVITGLGGGADGDRVVAALKAHFAAIKSVRAKVTQRSVEAGGLLADDPLKAPPRHHIPPKGRRDEYEVWHAPPKFRQSWTEVGRDTSHGYYDGKTFTALFPRNQTGYTTGRVIPPRDAIGSAIGFRFPDNPATTLADLLDRPAGRTVSRVGKVGDADAWLVEVRSPRPELLPGPDDWGDKARQTAVVRIWVTTAPEVIVHRWAIYHAGVGGWSPKALADLKKLGVEPHRLPVFELAGHRLSMGYVNCDFQPAEDVACKRKVSMPTRFLYGNALGTGEGTVHELVVNPAEGKDSFQPPAGYDVKPSPGGG
jgi:hypothetical protein